VSSKSLFTAVLMGWCCSLLPGCGGAELPRTEVLGEVTLDGDPVGEAQVYLTVKSPAFGDKTLPATFSAAVVDGSFEFESQQGPPPGEYEVVLKPVEPDAEEAFEELRKRSGSLLADRNKFLNAVQRKGPIRVELSADEVNELSIELTSR
jgi:hypothetical protein